MKMKFKVLFFIGFTALLVATFIAAKKVQNQGYKVGDKVKDFNLQNVDGQYVSIKGLKNSKGAIVIFTCNTCPYSKLYEDRIIALDKKYAPKGYPVLAINPNDAEKHPKDSFENMVKRAKEKSFPFPYLHDESQAVAKRFGATRTPHVYVVQKVGGDLKVAYIGAIDNNSKGKNITDFYVDDAIKALLEGKDVPLNYTKAIGCTIKWKKS